MKSAALRLRLLVPGFCLCLTGSMLAAEASKTPEKPKPQVPIPSGPQTDGSFRKVILEADRNEKGEWQDTLKDPMELAVAPDGRVFFAERAGTIKVWKPTTKSTVVIAKIPVFDGLEDGMLGLTLDPNFARNGWVYLTHSLPETTQDQQGKKTGVILVSRYTLRGDELDLASEKKLLEIPTTREPTCHVGGSLAFDGQGNLFISIGDNTNPFESDGYSPSDERPGRAPFDAQKSAANPNDLRGKISRIHPEPDGTVTIPSGNLFPPGTPGTRPEVFVMGCRNPFRLAVDRKTGYLYWGEVGPDAGGMRENRGPAGHDEVNQARQAGNFGWPYFVGDNKAYWHWDFAAKTNLYKHDPLHPLNRSPNNTGKQELPPAQPAFVYYPSGASTRFPTVNAGGGRTAMAGPVYYFDPKLDSPHKLPKEYDHTLFIYEWSRNWIIAVHLDANNNIARDAQGKPRMERFCPQMTFKRPTDLELGPDGCLYLIEFGTAWGSNLDSQIVRIEYAGNVTAQLNSR